MSGKSVAQSTVRRSDVIRDELLKLESEGPLTPERIVKVARPKYHPLHDCFEWDDKKAGHAFRLWQARKLVAVYLVEVIGETSRRTHLSVVVENEGRRYVSRERVVSEKELRVQAIAYIRRMIGHWRRQYKFLEEMLDEMESVVKRYKRKKRKKK